MVDAVKKTHPGKFKIEERVAEDHKADLDKLAIDGHGVVCNLDGKTLWKHNHNMTQSDFDAGLKTVLDSLK